MVQSVMGAPRHSPWTIPLSLKAVWSACHYQKKLAKKQIVDTDILETVDRIVEFCVHGTAFNHVAFPLSGPPSLRVSGGLLVGVTRLYNRQVEYFETNCSALLQRMDVPVAVERTPAGGRQKRTASSSRRRRAGAPVDVDCRFESLLLTIPEEEEDDPAEDDRMFERICRCLAVDTGPPGTDLATEAILRPPAKRRRQEAEYRQGGMPAPDGGDMADLLMSLGTGPTIARHQHTVPNRAMRNLEIHDMEPICGEEGIDDISLADLGVTLIDETSPASPEAMSVDPAISGPQSIERLRGDPTSFLSSEERVGGGVLGDVPRYMRQRCSTTDSLDDVPSHWDAGTEPHVDRRSLIATPDSLMREPVAHTNSPPAMASLLQSPFGDTMDDYETPGPDIDAQVSSVRPTPCPSPGQVPQEGATDPQEEEDNNGQMEPEPEDETQMEPESADAVNGQAPEEDKEPEDGPQNTSSSSHEDLPQTMIVGRERATAFVPCEVDRVTTLSDRQLCDWQTSRKDLFKRRIPPAAPYTALFSPLIYGTVTPSACLYEGVLHGRLRTLLVETLSKPRGPLRLIEHHQETPAPVRDGSPSLDLAAHGGVASGYGHPDAMDDDYEDPYGSYDEGGEGLTPSPGHLSDHNDPWDDSDLDVPDCLADALHGTTWDFRDTERTPLKTPRPPQRFLRGGGQDDDVSKDHDTCFQQKQEDTLARSTPMEHTVRTPAGFRTTVPNWDTAGRTADIRTIWPFVSRRAQALLQTEVGFSKRTIRLLHFFIIRLSDVQSAPRSNQDAAMANLSSSSHPPSVPTTGQEGSSDNDDAAMLADSPSSPAISFKSVVAGQRRDVVAGTFFEVLALRTRQFLDFAPVASGPAGPFTSTAATDILLLTGKRYTYLAQIND